MECKGSRLVLDTKSLKGNPKHFGKELRGRRKVADNATSLLLLKLTTEENTGRVCLRQRHGHTQHSLLPRAGLPSARPPSPVPGSVTHRLCGRGQLAKLLVLWVCLPKNGEADYNDSSCLKEFFCGFIELACKVSGESCRRGAGTRGQQEALKQALRCSPDYPGRLLDFLCKPVPGGSLPLGVIGTLVTCLRAQGTETNLFS